jgi:Siphovirus Gp157
MNAPPSAFALQRCVSDAMRTLETLREDHGQVFDDSDSVLAALQDENIDVTRILRRLIGSALDDEASAAATKLRIADLKIRMERFERHEETKRGIAAMVMEALLPVDKKGNRTFSSPEFGLTLAPGKPKVIITSDKKVPEEFLLPPAERQPDKTKIKVALDAGTDLDFAELSNGTPVLTVRSR